MLSESSRVLSDPAAIALMIAVNAVVWVVVRWAIEYYQS